MGRWTWSLLLLAGCATSNPQPEPPLAPEHTYERIRDVFLRAPVIQFRFWTMGRPKEEEPGSAVLVGGNRARIASKMTSPDNVFVSNGTRAMITAKVGEQPAGSEISADLIS